jgi:hypothetical protein
MNLCEEKCMVQTAGSLEEGSLMNFWGDPDGFMAQVLGNAVKPCGAPAQGYHMIGNQRVWMCDFHGSFFQEALRDADEERSHAKDAFGHE